MILYLEWIEDAACKGTDDPVFFGPDQDTEGTPPGSELGRLRSETAQRDLTAKIRYCAECPVRLKCSGLGWSQEYGIYGGWSPQERRMHDEGRFLPTRVRSIRSASRDEAVRLIREGVAIPDIAVKMSMTPTSVLDYLRQAWTLATQSDVRPTA